MVNCPFHEDLWQYRTSSPAKPGLSLSSSRRTSSGTPSTSILSICGRMMSQGNSRNVTLTSQAAKGTYKHQLTVSAIVWQGTDIWSCKSIIQWLLENYKRLHSWGHLNLTVIEKLFIVFKLMYRSFNFFHLLLHFVIFIFYCFYNSIW